MAGPGPASRRSRRSEASSSSESALGTFDISNLDNRVVTPPRSLPLVTYRSDSDDDTKRLKALFGDAFERKAVELTSNIGIPTATVDASFRYSSTSGHMTAISLFKLGFDGDLDNPNTVYGRYSKTVNAGDDVGAHRYIKREDGKLLSPMVGTLGCWIEIKIKDRGWKKVGLTCYHVIRPCLDGFRMRVEEVEKHGKLVLRKPKKDSDLWAADIHGLKTEGSGGRLVEHPTRAKHNFTIEDRRERVERLESTGYPNDALDVKAGLDEAIAFFDGDNQLFGQVIFASGYMGRTRANGRLDWALISPRADRIGGNPLPSEDAWQAKKYDYGNIPVELKGNIRPQAHSIYELEGDNTLDKVVFKNGASTTCTKGVFSKVKTDCAIAEERYMLEEDHVPRQVEAGYKSREFAFISPDGVEGTFASRGDSGAVAWDQYGRVMGLLFTGQKPQQADKGYSLVTPIEDVFQDIMDKSEGSILGIRIPTDGGDEDVEMA
ncbi:hypothetical protein B0T25DRAFT_591639 [Lasiosphaeria hispida]|uniref:Uncharacterized protein n=1 Tax=Lasiosphaeria hispida TaxID=260671 RepID=A0AAJ0HE35_9PEZI|nr:hypothetical protein B0T25DRAFT_591639 [Lasiosphaeria hispida]